MSDKIDKAIITEGILRSIQMNTTSRHTPAWLHNIGINLYAHPEHGIKDFDLPDDRKKETIFICGPGASMHQYKDLLPQLRKHGTIFMQPTAYQWYKQIGLEPDVVIAVDHLPIQYTQLSGYTGPVIVPTTIDPDFLKMDSYYYPLYQGNGTPKPGDDNPELFAWWNLAMWGLHHNTVGQRGYVSAMDVTNMAYQIAVDMMEGWGGVCNIGAKRIVLIGCDRCFWEGYQRVKAIHGSDEELPKMKIDDFTITYRNQLTNHAMVAYIYTLYWLWVERGAPTYRMDHGVMHEIPFVSLNRILKDDYPQPWAKTKVERHVAKFFDEFTEVVPHMVADQEALDHLMEELHKVRKGQERNYNE